MDQAPTSACFIKQKVFNGGYFYQVVIFLIALLTFRQGQIPEFNSLDETRSLFSNL